MTARPDLVLQYFFLQQTAAFEDINTTLFLKTGWCFLTLKPGITHP